MTSVRIPLVLVHRLPLSSLSNRHGLILKPLSLLVMGRVSLGLVLNHSILNRTCLGKVIVDR